MYNDIILYDTQHIMLFTSQRTTKISFIAEREQENTSKLFEDAPGVVCCQRTTRYECLLLNYFLLLTQRTKKSGVRSSQAGCNKEIWCQHSQAKPSKLQQRNMVSAKPSKLLLLRTESESESTTKKNFEREEEKKRKIDVHHMRHCVNHDHD